MFVFCLTMIVQCPIRVNNPTQEEVENQKQQEEDEEGAAAKGYGL